MRARRNFGLSSDCAHSAQTLGTIDLLCFVPLEHADPWGEGNDDADHGGERRAQRKTEPALVKAIRCPQSDHQEEDPERPLTDAGRAAVAPMGEDSFLVRFSVDELIRY